MNTELDDIYQALNLAHTVLSGMTHLLYQSFGWPTISEKEVLEFIKKGEKVDI